MNRTTGVIFHKEAPALQQYVKDNDTSVSLLCRKLLTDFLKAEGYDVDEYDAAYKASIAVDKTAPTDWSK